MVETPDFHSMDEIPDSLEPFHFHAKAVALSKILDMAHKDLDQDSNDFPAL
jgi:hypothetical protein